MTSWMRGARAVLGGAAMAALLSACGGNFFEVEAPGRIADEDLNTRDAVDGIVTGMSYDLAQATNGVLETGSLAAAELWHSGSYNLGDIPRGIVLPEDINTEWNTIMQARWVTMNGVARIQGIVPADEFNRSPAVARAYLLAGFANRLVGELVCETITPVAAGQSGSPEPNTAEWDRGIANFTKAIEIGTAAGTASATIVNAAYAGRASLKAWKGDWDGAVLDAQRVPASFVYYAILMTEGANNDIYYETHDRGEYTVFNTEFASPTFNANGDDVSDDPRVPWFIVRVASGAVRPGANGSTPWYRQRKYIDLGADVPLVKGTEMLVLRAERELRRSTPDIAAARDLMNLARRQYGMADLPATATQDLATTWRTLHVERGATVWLENRRWWDLRRWFAEGPSSPAYHSFLADRPQGRCLPISENERLSNPNVP